ncbi:hypothetical protein [Chromohalobacter israelensis]|uniref:hypothetical protein n=1 Tax=Chromohalobacter israelensis TaxID=141390 RepID=UPI0005581B62|nr:hypothetical protein [Chromohalobacter israelensis]MDF9434630.1 hypothetical protein [Chromohalobacter israelensis]
MSLKKLLWNDNATELFGHRRDQDEHVAPERPEKGNASHRPYTARKVLKGSAAFTSALLFGNGESQGLIRTFGQASAEAGKTILRGKQDPSTSTDAVKLDMYGLGGPGYYDKNGVIKYRLDDDE